MSTVLKEGGEGGGGGGGGQRVESALQGEDLRGSGEWNSQVSTAGAERKSKWQEVRR